MSYNFNTDPYFDDYDELNDYLRILFRPGTAVQARELTQIQTILQGQVNSIGKHLFKEGSPVVGGKLHYAPRTDYVKIDTSGITLSTLEGKSFKNSAGVEANIVHTEESTTSEPDEVLYVRYTRAGVSGEKVFAAGETLTEVGGTLSVTIQGSTAGNIPIGLGSMLTVSNSIYYISGFFVKVKQTNLILNRYDSIPAFTCGIKWEHSITTSAEDFTLNDNATGTPNYAAPGAHRYSIDATFIKYPFNDEGTKSRYIELYRIEGGTSRLMQDTPNYSEIEHELAKRTYDESGNYVAKDFKINFKEDRNNFIENWVGDRDYIIGDIIRETDVTTNKTYTYECTAPGTSASSKPTFATDYDTFSDGGVTWQFVKSVYLNNGAYPAITEDGSYEGREDTYLVEVSDGIGVVEGYSYTQKDVVIRLKNTKARDFEVKEDAIIPIPTPQYILVEDPTTLPGQIGTDFIDLEIYDEFAETINYQQGTTRGTKIGTAKGRWVEEHNDGVDLYRIYIHDIIIGDTALEYSRNGKCIHSTSGLGSVPFTANITQSFLKLSGAISGTQGSSVITSVGALFKNELKVGDYITSDGGLNKYKVGSISADGTSITTSSPLANAIVTSAYSLVRSDIKGGSNSAVYKAPNNFIKSLSPTGSSATSYYMTRRLDSQSTGTGTTLNYTLPPSSNETFAPITPSNYTIIETTSGDIATGYTITRSNGNKDIDITGLVISTAYTVLSTIRKQQGEPIGQSLHVDYIDLVTSGTVNVKNISLGRADCTKLLAVKSADNFGTVDANNPLTKDITNQFKLNSGQTPLMYGLSSVDNNSSTINGSIRIYFEYHQHSLASARDFFSVESYGSTDYTNIPANLRDSLDFRPIVNDSGVGFKSTDFGILKYDNDINADYSYYLPREDAVILTSNKEIKLIKGESGLVPQSPRIPDGSIVLYSLGNVPYGGVLSNAVKIKKHNHRRYTMKDIGKLDQRINNIEYYTALNMLEQETIMAEVLDPDGYSLFKNGFIVDSFTSLSVGDISSPDYKCFINTGAGELSSPITESHIKLRENSLPADRASNNYVVNENLITLPFTEVEYLGNETSSSVSNVNPFAVVSFIGGGSITPESDVWIDRETLPVIRDHNY